ncbi:pentapeptide repeat-containing protein [Nostoc sp. FACHB-110]
MRANLQGANLQGADLHYKRKFR